jgi:prepilin-type N-terminal cleavage/methylation domain-containing protein
MTTFSKDSGQEGFSLLEIIAVLTVVAVLGALMFQLFGDSFTKSSEPIDRLKKALKLQETMENITEDYQSSPKTGVFLDTTLRIAIGPEGTDQNNAYGQYHVVNNRFIKFVGLAEADIAAGDPRENLKVTLRNDVGEILTTLFTVQ